MKGLNIYSSLKAIQKYLKFEINSYKADNWVPDVRHVLSGTSLDTWEDKMPADKNTWEDWKDCYNEMAKQSMSTQNHVGNEIELNAEQNYVAMSLFLEKRYWNKNNDVTLPEVLKDIEINFQADSMEGTEFWRQWRESAEAASKFDRNFD